MARLFGSLMSKLGIPIPTKVSATVSGPSYLHGRFLSLDFIVMAETLFSLLTDCSGNPSHCTGVVQSGIDR